MRLIGFLFTIFLVAGACTAHADTRLDDATKTYLEGGWVVDLDGRPCAGGPPLKDRFEFEFRKTGGRMLQFKVPDGFGAATIESAERSGEVVTITFLAPEGGVPVEWRLTLRKNDLSIVTKDRNKGAQPAGSGPVVARRCDEPDWSVTGTVPSKTLKLLSPLRLRPGKFGIPFFIQAERGASDETTCAGASEKRPRLLYFEVFGPVHYFVVGRGFSSRFDFTPIQSVRSIEGGKLAIEVEGRGESDGETLTIEFEEPRIRIQELDAEFVRCDSRDLTVLRIN